MPVYNSEKYLKKSISSVLNQSFKDFELILIDDGSTDSSLSVCQDFAKNDNRIHVIHQTNRGICDTRNRGIELSTGDYIAFIDNDDEYLPNLFKDNYALAIQHNADVVKFGIHNIKSDNENIISENDVSYEKFEIISKNDLPLFFENYYRSGATIFIWNALYKRSFIEAENLHFNKKHKSGHEDIEFNILMYQKLNSLIINPSVYYKYTRRTNHSTSASFDVNKLESFLYIIELEKELMRKMNSSNSFFNEIMAKEFYLYTAYMYHPLSKLSVLKKISYFRKFKKIVGKIKNANNTTKKQAIMLFLFNNKFYLCLTILKNIFYKINGPLCSI